MIDTSLLRLNILNLATSGKLSVSSEQDESVDALISRLPAPSNKRKKLLEQSFDYDDTFEIPDHWKWVRLGEICSYGDTPTKAMASDCEKGTWLLDLEDIQAGGKLLKKSKVGEKSSIGEKTSFKEGQLLYSKLRPYLKKVLVADEDGISTPELIASDVFCGINAQYLVYCLTNSYVDRVINKRSYGIKMPRVDAGFMVNLPIPLPPVEEQSRIVDVVMAAFLEIDNIDELQSQYASDLEVLKGKLIDAGIQGKLTEHLPEDGNAQDLFDVIQKKKAILVKEKKIKGIKTQNVNKEELDFIVPTNWIICALTDIAYSVGGKDNQIQTNELELEGVYPAISQGAQFIDGYCNDDRKVISDIPIILFGDHTRNIKYIDQPFVVCADGTKLMKPIMIDSRFFYYSIKYMARRIKVRGYARHFSLLCKQPFILPPYEEQKRIAGALDMLLMNM